MAKEETWEEAFEAAKAALAHALTVIASNWADRSSNALQRSAQVARALEIMREDARSDVRDSVRCYRVSGGQHGPPNDSRPGR